MTKAELKQLHADARKLVKILGSRPAPPVKVLEQRYRDAMEEKFAQMLLAETQQVERELAVLARRDRGDQ